LRRALSARASPRRKASTRPSWSARSSRSERSRSCEDVADFAAASSRRRATASSASVALRPVDVDVGQAVVAPASNATTQEQDLRGHRSRESRWRRAAVGTGSWSAAHVASSGSRTSAAASAVDERL
jgi:hypothetical protein